MHPPPSLLRPLQPPLIRPRIPTLARSPRTTTNNNRRLLVLRPARCASSGEGGDAKEGVGEGAEEAVAGMVEELLRREENRALLQGLEAASRRVERAREALADVERQECEARRAKDLVRRLERRRDEIAESQRELLEARAMVDEAQRSLWSNIEDSSSGDVLREDIDKNRERIESLKAAAISSVVGTLASLPISFYQANSFSQLIVHLSVVFISCALFGVTFRYTIRRDIDNIQLKTGTSAAFGLVKGLAAVEAAKPSELNIDSFISLSVDGAVYLAENIFVFLSAAIALDFCFKFSLLSPFPMRK
ncbi:uncharacterized protein LOC109728868 [Ananas comosus]|uniref:Uncharacterized protein LOC109728868 n=1 Tax=Ananas comosus TaxID=4615 RepID=A0A6P5H5Y4_ANACO|nr:uncharacterized protein LOC109728868 [Ananas comosus]